MRDPCRTEDRANSEDTERKKIPHLGSALTFRLAESRNSTEKAQIAYRDTGMLMTSQTGG